MPLQTMIVIVIIGLTFNTVVLTIHTAYMTDLFFYYFSKNQFHDTSYSVCGFAYCTSCGSVSL